MRSRTRRLKQFTKNEGGDTTREIHRRRGQPDVEIVKVRMPNGRVRYRRIKIKKVEGSEARKKEVAGE